MKAERDSHKALSRITRATKRALHGVLATAYFAYLLRYSFLIICVGRGAKTPRCLDAMDSYVSSLSVVLAQALGSGDNNLLDYCLNTKDRRAIDATVERLPAPQVAPFLAAIVTKCEVAPLRSPALVVWIDSILKHHKSYLLTAVDIVPCIANVHRITEERLGAFDDLLRLSGRLAFITRARAAPRTIA